MKKDKKVVGIFSLASRGFGFVKHPKGKDIFIPAKYTLAAITGDSVEVMVTTTAKDRWEGRVAKIVKRSTKELTVIVIAKDRKGYICYSVVLGNNRTIYLASKDKFKVGDRLLVTVKKWHPKIYVLFKQYLGSIDNPDVDIAICALDFKLATTFSDHEKAFAEIAKSNKAKKRVDLTHLECITVDPDDAKDFDDAISLNMDDDGSFQLGIHIADVSHFVESNSLLDKAAFTRGNSTYFPGLCLPMLPSTLSFEACSLMPNVIRFAVSVLVKFNKEGVVLNYSVVRSKIKSRRRFTYAEAFDILNNRKKSAFKSTFFHLHRLASLLKSRRMLRGSVDLSMPETRVVILPNGEPERIDVVEHDIAHQLIEEFMLKANEIVASWAGKERAIIYRIHEKPSKESLHEFYMSARALGFALPTHPTDADVQAMFSSKEHPELLQYLSLLYVKSMKLAEYSTDNSVGHYGLRLKKYTHFTSPIRRYADLVVHRILFGAKVSKEQLDKICMHLSATERNSMRAEQFINRLKKLRLLYKNYLQNRNEVYTGLVSKIKPFGIFFDLTNYYVEGFLHISKLGDEYFVFNAQQSSLTGKDTATTLALGSAIKVRISSFSLILQEVSFEMVQ